MSPTLVPGAAPIAASPTAPVTLGTGRADEPASPLPPPTSSPPHPFLKPPQEGAEMREAKAAAEGGDAPAGDDAAEADKPADDAVADAPADGAPAEESPAEAGAAEGAPAE